MYCQPIGAAIVVLPAEHPGRYSPRSNFRPRTALSASMRGGNSLKPARGLWQWAKNPMDSCACILTPTFFSHVPDCRFRSLEDGKTRSRQARCTMSSPPGWAIDVCGPRLDGVVALLGAVGLWIRAASPPVAAHWHPRHEGWFVRSSPGRLHLHSKLTYLMRGNNAPRRTPHSLPAYAIPPARYRVRALPIRRGVDDTPDRSSHYGDGWIRNCPKAVCRP